jgi:DNA-binding response OmpR family regulator
MRHDTNGRALRSLPLSVMMIDPDGEGARRLARQLAGVQIMIVGSIAEAIQTLHVRMPDLIVTELDLPDDDGVRFVREVHNNVRTRHVLLVVVTRRNAIRDKIAALQAGADDYLVKPVEPQQFAMHIRAVSRFRRTLG